MDVYQIISLKVYPSYICNIFDIHHKSFNRIMGKHAGSFKITYSTMNAELLEEFHQQFDVALAKVK